MKYAIIEDGKVVNIALADAPLADNWIDATGAKKGDLWDGSTFTTPPAPPIYATAQEARFAMTAWIDDLTGQIQAEYPDVVQKGWDEEEAMARAFLAGSSTAEQEAILAADAAAKGRTSTAHAERIVEKADTFRAIALETRTLWLATDKALEDATDPLQYEAILDAAKAQAAPLAAAYGLTV